MILISAVVFSSLAAVLVLVILSKKNMLVWMPAYLKRAFVSKAPLVGPRHILFSFVDHFEPQWGSDVSIELERERVDRWLRRYPELVMDHADSDGVVPQHTFFYPEEEYRFEHLEKISDLCARGYGEIEIHLHHDKDTDENLRKTLLGFCQLLRENHGALPTDPDSGETGYGFIHGNWSLDNSGPMCGVNNELIVLRETGCYADFTFPSAPHPSQPRTINSIYYAKDDPVRPKSHDTVQDIKVGGTPWGDILLINGPLMLNWRSRKFGIMPRIENGDIRAGMEPTPHRVDLWVDANVHVEGRPEWIFVKVHTHGVQESDEETLLGKPMNEMFSYLEERYNDGEEFCLHYVNSREMFNIAKAAEDGKEGNPNSYRDYKLEKPKFRRMDT